MNWYSPYSGSRVHLGLNFFRILLLRLVFFFLLFGTAHSQEAISVLKSYELRNSVSQPNVPPAYEGLLRRAPVAGLDWYFTSLALSFASPDAMSRHRRHFERALALVVHPGPMPANLDDPEVLGLRIRAQDGQLWELFAHAPVAAMRMQPAVNFPIGAPSGVFHTDAAGRRWRSMGRVGADVAWSLLDTDDSLKFIRHADSHDSTAAVFVYSLSRYALETDDLAWLLQTQWVKSGEGRTPATTISRLDVLKAMIRHNLLNEVEGQLVRTFRKDRAPDGRPWSSRYLMDNIEVLASLKIAAKLFERLGQPAYASVLNRYAGTIEQGIAALTVKEGLPAVGYLRWENKSQWPITSGEISFYPEVGSQYWLTLWSLPVCGLIKTPATEQFTQMEPHFGVHSDWWRSNQPNFQMGLGPFVARYAIDSGARANAQRLLRRFPQEGCTQDCTAFVPDLISDAVFLEQIRNYDRSGVWAFQSQTKTCAKP